MCGASSTESRNHLTFSTKAWYAAFLVSKNRIIGPEVSRADPALLD
jgi:hypothetical protein